MCLQYLIKFQRWIIQVWLQWLPVSNVHAHANRGDNFGCQHTDTERRLFWCPRWSFGTHTLRLGLTSKLSWAWWCVLGFLDNFPDFVWVFAPCLFTLLTSLKHTTSTNFVYIWAWLVCEIMSVFVRMTIWPSVQICLSIYRSIDLSIYLVCLVCLSI